MHACMHTRSHARSHTRRHRHAREETDRRPETVKRLYTLLPFLLSLFSSACAWQLFLPFIQFIPIPFPYPLLLLPGRLMQQRIANRSRSLSVRAPIFISAQLPSSTPALPPLLFSIFTPTPDIHSRLKLPCLALSSNCTCSLILRRSSPHPVRSRCRPWPLLLPSFPDPPVVGGYTFFCPGHAKPAALSSQGNGYQLAVPFVDPLQRNNCPLFLTQCIYTQRISSRVRTPPQLPLP
jgi:hypothetical protein